MVIVGDVIICVRIRMIILMMMMVNIFGKYNIFICDSKNIIGGKYIIMGVQEFVSNNKNVVIIVVVIIVVLIIVWCMKSKMVTSEKFGQEMMNDNEMVYRNSSGQIAGIGPMPSADVSMETRNMAVEMENTSSTLINPRVAGVMSGPGFESNVTEMTGMEQDVVSKLPSNYYFLDDGADGKYSIQHNNCSKNCCSSQWPLPFKMKKDPYLCQNKDQFVGSNIFCNNAYNDSGCLCLEKSQAQFLYTRGKNGDEWF